MSNSRDSNSTVSAKGSGRSYPLSIISGSDTSNVAYVDKSIIDGIFLESGVLTGLTELSLYGTITDKVSSLNEVDYQFSDLKLITTLVLADMQILDPTASFNIITGLDIYLRSMKAIAIKFNTNVSGNVMFLAGGIN
jgi:hypothetical protein